MTNSTAATPSVAIIGAGLSGMIMGSALKDSGIESFTIFEKAGEVGGTWRENRYPGLTCDVPGRFYSFRKRPNPDWSHLLAPGSEIQQYMLRYADEEGLRRFMEMDTEIASAEWEGDHWRLVTAAGDEHHADVVVCATGVLHHPKMPEIEGMETFAGPSFHSARWDESVSLADKRVAIVGTGSTSAQIVGAIAGVASHVDVYQRSRHWVFEIANPEYSDRTRKLLNRFRKLNRVGYAFWDHVLRDFFGHAVITPGPRRRFAQWLVRWNMNHVIKDDALRAKIVPDYEPLCKRLVIAPNYLKALQRPDVELLTDGIDRVESGGIRTKDGVLHEADVIVYCTGFDAAAFMRPMAITGKDGLTLEEAWADGPQAYRSVAIPGFPNMFTLQGPHSPVGNYSLVAVAETQVAYAMQWIERIRRGEVVAASPRQDVTDAYYREMEKSFPTTTWAGGCQSWYHNAEGKIGIWAWSVKRHGQLLDHVEPADFEIERPVAAMHN